MPPVFDTTISSPYQFCYCLISRFNTVLDTLIASDNSALNVGDTYNTRQGIQTNLVISEECEEDWLCCVTMSESIARTD